MKKIMMLGLMALGFTCLSNPADAARDRWEFTNGAVPGFTKLDNGGGWRFGQMNILYRTNKVGRRSYAAVLVSEILRKGTAQGGGLWNNKRYNKGFFQSRNRLNGYTTYLSWGAWWIWNDVKSNRTLEVDMMETTPQGNQFNHYWDFRNGQAAGRKNTRPNSYGWRNIWRNYGASAIQGRSFVDFRLSGLRAQNYRSNGPVHGSGRRLKFNNRPFAFNPGVFNQTTYRRLGNQEIDYCQVDF